METANGTLVQQQMCAYVDSIMAILGATSYSSYLKLITLQEHTCVCTHASHKHMPYVNRNLRLPRETPLIKIRNFLYYLAALESDIILKPFIKGRERGREAKEEVKSGL